MEISILGVSGAWHIALNQSCRNAPDFFTGGTVTGTGFKERRTIFSWSAPQGYLVHPASNVTSVGIIPLNLLTIPESDFEKSH